MSRRKLGYLQPTQLQNASFQENIQQIEGVLRDTDYIKNMREASRELRMDCGRNIMTHASISAAAHIRSNTELLRDNLTRLKMWHYGFYDEPYSGQDQQSVTRLVGRLRHDLNFITDLGNRYEDNNRIHLVRSGYGDARQKSPVFDSAQARRPLNNYLDTWGPSRKAAAMMNPCKPIKHDFD